MALAGLGRRDEALREAEWLKQSIVYREDAFDGPLLAEDRARMKDSWTGLVGVEVEDASIALSQGAFYDRSKEHLVPADRAVVRVRRVLLDSVQRVRDKLDPVGVGVDLTAVGACDSQLTDGERWQSLMPAHRSLKAAA